MNEPYTYRFEPAAAAGARETLLLLHGTGGNESDLVPVGRAIAPQAALLSPRGQVVEHGQARFFRRLAVGVFDEADLRSRTRDLAAFVAGAATRHGFDPARVHAVGFSNGANIAASLLLLSPQTLAGAVLLRAMVPLVPETLPALAGRPVLISAGRADGIVPPERSEALAELLRRAGANVTLHWAAGGHGLERSDLAAAASWWGAAVGA
jgi:predicted esterase